MPEKLPEACQEDEERCPNSQDDLHHAPVDDMAARITRLLIHHSLVGGEGGQCHGRKGVHDQIDPEHLCDIQGGIDPRESTDKNHQTCADVDDHLEHDEPADIEV